MGKYMGNFEDLFDDIQEDNNLENWEQDEESKYWIHRTKTVPLYFNPNFKSNGCPMIITQEEISEIFFVPYKKFKQMVNNKQPDLLRHDEEFKILFEMFDKEFDN